MELFRDKKRQHLSGERQGQRDIARGGDLYVSLHSVKCLELPQTTESRVIRAPCPQKHPVYFYYIIMIYIFRIIMKIKLILAYTK